MGQSDVAVIRQHLIDPEICIRCNTCEATCPVGAITHDSRNYVVDAAICNLCMACVPPCPTGSIDNWRTVPKARAWAIEAQLEWDSLPVELPAEALQAQALHPEKMGQGESAPEAHTRAQPAAGADTASAEHAGVVMPAANRWGSTLPPWSAAHPYTNLYGPRATARSIVATVAGNVRVTAAGRDYDTHHIVLDFGNTPFPVLEGQSIGVVAPGNDAEGRPHHPRQYSVSSPRNGERPGYNNLSLTVKRVLVDQAGQAVRGVASNFLCDLAVGDPVTVTGPFGASFLMPNHPRSHLVMICTGTGSAPMRAMTEWRRRARSTGTFEGAKLLLFFGARSQEDLPYFGPLQKLPTDFIDINLAFSRTPGAPKQYVQDLMRERSADLAPLLANPDAYFYVCGLKAMEAGVIHALEDIAREAGLDWLTLGEAMKRDGRLHLETY